MQLSAAQKQIDSGWQSYSDSKAQLEQGEAEYAQGQETLTAQLSDGQVQLDDSRRKLEDGEQEYADGQDALQESEEQAQESDF